MEKLILLLILQLEYGPDNSILNRSITTNANLNNGEVLVLGGLVKTKLAIKL